MPQTGSIKIVPVIIPFEEELQEGHEEDNANHHHQHQQHTQAAVIATNDQIKLVQSSFEKLKPVAVSFVTIFYERLLSEHEELQAIFSSVGR